MSRKREMPGGIPYIVSNEAAERFSYYGMKAILTIFMVDYLKMTESDSTIWIHSFGLAAYALPIIGAFIADIWLGKYLTIIALSLFYCLGHGVLAVWDNQTGLAVGLAFIAIGSGGIKPNVSSHVGDQFTKKNSHLIERVFSWFYLSINVGSLASTLLIPYLLNHYGPHVAFGVPGLLMLIATWVFWLGREKFIAVPPKGLAQYTKEVFTPETGRIILKLAGIYVFIAVFWSLYDQTMSTWILQAKRDIMIKTFDLGFWKFELLPEQVQAINPFFILVLTPFFSFVVYPIVGRFVKLTTMRKISAGLFVTALSFWVIAWLEGQLEAGHTMHISWQFLAYFIITSAEVMVSITALEFSYTQAPIAIKSFIMALFWFTITAGNIITIGVNVAILEDVPVNEVTTGEHTYLYTKPPGAKDDWPVKEGHKIGLEGVEGVQMISGSDTGKLAGTFLVTHVQPENHSFEILDINRRPVHSISTGQQKPVVAQLNMLKGTSYYYFFVWMMLGAAVLFIFVARQYQEEAFIHEDRAEAEGNFEVNEPI